MFRAGRRAALDGQHSGERARRRLHHPADQSREGTPELRNQVDGRDDPYHRHQDGDLRATRHAWVLAQATDHGDAGGDESGQFLHEPRRESGGQQDQHRPRREQAPEGDKTYCPYKGECAYYSIPAGGERSVNAVWTYEVPYAAVSAIREYLAFYPDRVDAIEVGVED